jgi:hypothetical protein
LQAGHNALSPYAFVNAAIGLPLHTFLLVPYYSWRATHRTHHVCLCISAFILSLLDIAYIQKSTNNLERDETFIPPTRKDFKLPDGNVAVKMDYKDVLEETPLFTLFKLVMRQLL